jgi:hypothetical protein
MEPYAENWPTCEKYWSGKLIGKVLFSTAGANPAGESVGLSPNLSACQTLCPLVLSFVRSRWLVLTGRVRKRKQEEKKANDKAADDAANQSFMEKTLKDSNALFLSALNQPKNAADAALDAGMLGAFNAIAAALPALAPSGPRSASSQPASNPHHSAAKRASSLYDTLKALALPENRLAPVVGLLEAEDITLPEHLAVIADRRQLEELIPKPHGTVGVINAIWAFVQHLKL